MKKILFVVMALLTVGCSKDNNEAILGTWVVSSDSWTKEYWTTEPGTPNWDTCEKSDFCLETATFTFYDDGTMLCLDENQVLSYQWKFAGDQLLIGPNRSHYQIVDFFCGILDVISLSKRKFVFERVQETQRTNPEGSGQMVYTKYHIVMKKK